ncbi:zinc-binding dehydrogenase [Paraburkholderia denitrificans]|uniref:Zinc-binding dehydrogenase n=1 Tax=Paraburkholderia denitrificans TaxID=694025 RepID=A0ABW0J387_9BURK
MSNTMIAAIMRVHGGPEVLSVEAVARPVPDAGEVLVKVAACSLSRLDIFIRDGMPGRVIEMPHVGGCDVAGWIEEIGPDVSDLQIGAPVLINPFWNGEMLGEAYWGGFSEYVIVSAKGILKLPEDKRLVEYSCLPTAYGTAYRMLHSRGHLTAGESLAVVGASGGVGVACVQLGARAGAHVIACTSSEDKSRRLKAIGASECVVAPDGQFGKQVWNLTGKQGADVVVDFTGTATWPQSLRSVKHGGRLLCCGATTGFEAMTDLRYLWTREIDIRGSDGWAHEDLRQLLEIVAGNEFEPVIHAVFPLSKIQDAMRELEGRSCFGKIVVVPDDVFASRCG